MQRRVEVIVRVRPSENPSEDSCVSFSADRKRISVSDKSALHSSMNGRSYCQDSLFDADATNRELFEKLVLGKMSTATSDAPDTLCFLAYGHTCSGKTHTIAGSETEAGVLTLCVEELLSREGVVEISMLEIYMDTVQDLLAEGAARRIRRRPSGNAAGGTAIVVEGLTTCAITSVAQWKAVSAYGMRSRRTAPTDRNARSSRSHAIFTIKTFGVRLCLVDLAGSERQTVFSPQLNKESIAINKSLSRLSTVLEALSTQRVLEDGTRSYVNFRDTTLTVLLQRYLSGASMTTFLACVHPSAQFCPETLSTLRYTQRLKKIKTAAARPDVNEMSGLRLGAHDELLGELLRLKEQLKHHESLSQTIEKSQRERIAELEDTLERQRQTGSLSLSPVKQSGDVDESGILARQLRARDTRRVAGWLLSRVLGDLPQINVGYDDYFDRFFPLTVQVIGYVSTMACLAPRATDDDALAFLDVGDLSMGLTMVDAGIPSFVRLHTARCAHCESWEAYEVPVPGTPSKTALVYVLAFFEVSSQTMQCLAAHSACAPAAAKLEESDDSSSNLSCCGGYVSTEPLLPIATALCVQRSAPDSVKESILQELISLQGEQEEMTGRMAEVAGISQCYSIDDEDDAPCSASPAMRKTDDKGSRDDLAKEVARQSRDTSLLAAPFRASSSDTESSEEASDRVSTPAPAHVEAPAERVTSTPPSSHSSSTSTTQDLWTRISIAQGSGVHSNLEASIEDVQLMCVVSRRSPPVSALQVPPADLAGRVLVSEGDKDLAKRQGSVPLVVKPKSGATVEPSSVRLSGDHTPTSPTHMKSRKMHGSTRDKAVKHEKCQNCVML